MHALLVVVVVGVVEPVRTERHVGVAGHEEHAVLLSDRVVREIAEAGHGLTALSPRSTRGPGTEGFLGGKALLVAHPAHVRADVAEDRHAGLELADELPCVDPVVVRAMVDVAAFARAAVVAVAAVRAVEEELERRAVVGQDFAELFLEDGQVVGRAVLGVVAVPRGDVEPDVEAVLAAGVGHFLHVVALAVAEFRLRDVVLGGLGRPQAQAVVVLADDDDAGYAAVLARLYDLLGVEFGRSETLRVLVAVAPFLVVERVRTEMQDRVDVVVAALQDAFGGRAPCVEFREDGEVLLNFRVRVHELCVSGKRSREEYRGGKREKREGVSDERVHEKKLLAVYFVGLYSGRSFSFQMR